MADLPSTISLGSGDLKTLCDVDIKILSESLKWTQRRTSKVAVVMLPDLPTLQWHHAREEFMGNELLGRRPDVKGAMVGGGEGRRAWVVWTRDWAEVEGELLGRLYVLRLVVEGEEEEKKDGEERGGEEERTKKIAALLHAAVKEAAEWKLKEVQIWNPSEAVVEGAKIGFDEGDIEVIEREVENVCCLQWVGGDYEAKFGDTTFQDVTWVGNERFGWL
jgi:hypothetical protein